MTRFRLTVTKARLFAALIVLLFNLLIAELAQAATVFYQTGASGSGAQTAFALNTPISGTMTAPVPRFNGGLGTLIQADFEFAGSATGTWAATDNAIGNSSLSISGPADVDGQPMGTLAVGFTGTYDNLIGSNDFNAQYINLVVTSPALLLSYTGAGTFPMNWIYSGNTTLDIPAIGTSLGMKDFPGGGSIHVLYTYGPVPEPGAFVLAGMSLLGLLAIARKRCAIARRVRR